MDGLYIGAAGFGSEARALAGRFVPLGLELVLLPVSIGKLLNESLVG